MSFGRLNDQFANKIPAINKQFSIHLSCNAAAHKVVNEKNKIKKKYVDGK